MTRVVPASPSIILRARDIALIRIVSTSTEAWSSPPDGFPTRRVTLKVILEQVLKGQVRPKPDEAVSAAVVQYKNPSSWEIPLPGVWTDQPLEPGTRLVIFSNSERDDPGSLLPEPACLGVARASDALEGVRLALRAEGQPLRLEELLAAANTAAASLDIIFVQYLETRLSEPAMAEKKTFGVLLELLENRALLRAPRAALLSAILAAVSMDPVYSARHLERLALALFRLASATTDADLRENILTTLLPNLLGLSGGLELTAAGVFQDNPPERDRARSALRQAAATLDVTRLLAWIDR